MAGRYAEASDLIYLHELVKQTSDVDLTEDVSLGRVHILPSGKGIVAAHSMRVMLGSEGSGILAKAFDPKRKREEDSFEEASTGSIAMTATSSIFTKAATQQQTFPWYLCSEASLEGTVLLHVSTILSSSSSSSSMEDFLRGSADRLLPTLITAVVQLAIHLHPPPHNPAAVLRNPIRFALVAPKGSTEDKQQQQQQAESLFLYLVSRLTDYLVLQKAPRTSSCTVHRFVSKSSNMTMWVYELKEQVSISSLFAGMLSSLPGPSQKEETPRGGINPRPPMSPTRVPPSPRDNKTPSQAQPATTPSVPTLKGTITIPPAFRVAEDSSTSSSAIKPLPLSGSRVKPNPPPGPSIVTNNNNSNKNGRTVATPPPTLDPHRPTFFDLKDPIQLDALRALHASGEIRDYYDTIVQQMEGILQTRCPTHKLSEKEMAARKNTLLWETVGKGGSMALFGNWVFLPWKGALIHLLPKDMYQELRSNRNRYKISEEEQRQLRKAVIAVAGLSAGGSIATTVAMEGIGYRFHLADFDHLEISNLNRLQASILDLNVNKSYITARRLFEIDPYIEVEMFPEGVTSSNIDRFLKATFLFEECDSFDIKVILRRKAKALRLPVVMLTSDSGLLDVERFDLEPTRPMFHGLVEGVDMDALARGDWQTKMSFVRRITDPDRASNRMLVSLLEIQRSISTWPQLASDVVLGGSVGAFVAKKILLGTMKDSGRFYIDTSRSVCDNNPENSLRQPATTNSSNNIARVHDPYPSHKDISAMVAAVLSIRPDGPILAIEQKLLTMLVRYAQAAPSGGNAQPWLFVHLRNLPEESHNSRPYSSSVDQQRLLPFGLLACINPEVKACRSAPDRLPDFIALGASVENMVIALQGSGLKMEVKWFDMLPGWIHSSASEVVSSLRQPPGKIADPIHSCGALLTFARASEPIDPLSDAIPHRVSNRNNFGSGTPLKAEQVKALQDALVDSQRQWARDLPSLSLTIRPNDSENKAALQHLAQFHGETSRLRFLSPTMLEDLQDELRWTEEEASKRRDGIDIPSLQMPEGGDLPLYALKEQAGMEVLRKINGGTVLSDMNSMRIWRSAAVGMLSCSSKDRAAMFAAGRAVQRLWLAVTSMKLGFQPMYSGIFVQDFLKTRVQGSNKTPEQEMINKQGIEKLDLCQQQFFGPAYENHPHPVFIFAITDAPGPAQKSYRRPISSCLKIPGL